MGPRSDDRGEQHPRGWKLPTSKLQWGRGQMTAERAWPTTDGLRPAALQWGRGQMTAESRKPMKPTPPDPGFNGAAVR